jgi:energy-converting hydrogenase Eha subunit A
MIHYHRYNHDVTTNQVTVHIVIIVGVAMAIIVAIVVVVAMGVTVTAVKSDTPPTLHSPSATETINRTTSSTPPGVAVIKSLFSEGAVFLAALNMGTGGQGGTRNHMTRIAVASERARLGLIYRNFSCPTRWSSSAVMTHRYATRYNPP